MTLEGTNTWLVGARRVLVVDPGPADPAHLAAVLGEVGRDGGRLGGVLLTHRHPDHAEALGHPVLLAALAAAGAPVLALDPDLGRAPAPALLADACDEPGEVLRLPGHTDDSLALVLPERREVLTGDTVLGRGTSVVAHPDGDLTRYLASLDLLLGLTAPGAMPWRGLPGHGPVVADLHAAVVALRAHRRDRVEQVRAALAGLAGPTGTAGDPADDRLVAGVVEAVYPDLTDPVLLGAAARTVRATLVHLARPRAGG
ncbi:MBL fold metallo-hydrolase [Jannaschia sp. R86511]|uniref:MBL fold metallo-hydrolase n=1 Tax=Jannaschia sp. R86511 TaxID=3093853 RepID=UPI0036D2D76F